MTREMEGVIERFIKRAGPLIGLAALGGTAACSEIKPTVSPTSEVTTIALASREYKPVSDLSTCSWVDSTIGNKDPYNAFLSLSSQNVETPFLTLGDLSTSAQEAIDLLDNRNPFFGERIKTVNLLACADKEKTPVDFPFYETESGKFLMGVWQPTDQEGKQFNLVLAQLVKGSAKGTDGKTYLAYSIEDNVPVFTFNVPGEEVLLANFDAMTPEQQAQALAGNANFSPPEFLYDIVRQSKIKYSMAANSTEVLPTPTMSPATTETPTKVVTPTEAPIFTEAEVQAASPFDASTFPERFNKMTDPNFLKNASDQEWKDYDTFLKAVRANKGIAEVANFAEHINPALQSLWNGIMWINEHVDEVKEKQLVLEISPLEVQAMIEETRKPIEVQISGSNIGDFLFGFYRDVESPFQRLFYNSENLGQIMGRQIGAERIPYSKAHGTFVGVGSTGGQKVGFLDMIDTDNYHALFFGRVSSEKTILLKGSKGIDIFSHKGEEIYILPTDLTLLPLRDMGNGSVISWASLYDRLGHNLTVQTYRPDLGDTIPGGKEIRYFSPDLNLELIGTMSGGTLVPENLYPW